MSKPPSRWHRRFVLFCRQGGCCFYCDQQMVMKGNRTEPRRATIDHLQPLSQGGPRRIENEVAACFGCNNARGTIPWLVFYCLVQARIATNRERDAA